MNDNFENVRNSFIFERLKKTNKVGVVSERLRNELKKPQSKMYPKVDNPKESCGEFQFRTQCEIFFFLCVLKIFIFGQLCSLKPCLKIF